MEDAPRPTGSRLTELRTSARGWHGAQLAVLGFIGLCGVLQSQGDPAAPRWLQVVAGLLVVGALALACVSTALVASVAWPLSGWQTPGGSASAEAAEVDRGGRRLRRGVALTFVSMAALALAATSSWWPAHDDSSVSPVKVATRDGVICGQLVQGAPGVLAVESGGQRVVLRIADVLAVDPVDACDGPAG